ncbi:hypothetical protein Leryth_007697 [Lithospermum erythrorhizon]|nr:hypothetical protein Leryth_007697 [Lithospermum erythrorhizon]
MVSKRDPIIIITLNSSKHIIPSPLVSTPLIIFLHSANEQSSPRLLKTFCNSSAEMEPFLSMSKTENASLRLANISLESMSLVFNSMNSLRLMHPSPSPSTSLIITASSSVVAGVPRLRIMEPNSDAETLPSPLTSNFLKTCSNSSSILARMLTDEERAWDIDGGLVVVIVVVTGRCLFLRLKISIFLQICL